MLAQTKISDSLGDEQGSMTQDKHVYGTEHPLALGSFRSWLKLLLDSDGIERKFMPRALLVSLSTFLTSPLRLYERVRYDRAVRRMAIHPSPVFIVGHWRSGTTYLHHLMCQDKNLGYVSTFQAFAPDLCLVGENTIKQPLAKLAQRRHPTREIDNIPLSFDNPEEDELAIANVSPYSVFHWYTFPRQAPYFFERYALLNNIPESTLAEWTDIYLAVLRKASLRAGGKRLVIKNCANTARIKTLLGLFPNAKFIHIYRNPYDLFCSTLHLYTTVLRRAQLQAISAEETEAYVLRFYTQLMQRFLADKALIPAGDLVEVKYEDLEKTPLDQVRNVYEGLGLPGFADAEPAFRSYLDSIAGYKKNAYQMDNGVIMKVNQNWQFALDEWGYQRLEPPSPYSPEELRNECSALALRA